LDFSRFNQAVLQTPLTGGYYYDFEFVDAGMSFLNFQEDVLKNAFPELGEYGTSPETVLAYTDANGLLYDGFQDVIGSVAQRPDPSTVVFYIWEGMRYLQWVHGGRAVPELNVIVLDATPGSVRPDTFTSPPTQNSARTDGVIGTDMVLNEVFLNGESVYMSVRKGDLPLLFTQSVDKAPQGEGLRLMLSALQQEVGLRLHYNKKALETLQSLAFVEVCLAVGDQEQAYAMEALWEGL